MMSAVLRLFMGRVMKRLRKADRNEEMDDDEVDQIRSWGISAQLAAIDPGLERNMPEEVACLVRAAKELHPAMARGAIERAASGNQESRTV